MQKTNAFHLIPSAADKLKLNKQLENFYTREANLRKSVRLHLGLLLCTLSAERKSALLKFLSSEKLKINPVTVRIGNLIPIAIDYLGFSLHAPEIYQTHLTLLETVEPFTAEQFNPKYLKHDLSPVELKYLHQYGYHRVKEFFKAHLTIGKYLTKEIRDSELKLAPKIEGSFIFDTLQLDESIDGSGIPAEILWETKLT